MRVILFVNPKKSHAKILANTISKELKSMNMETDIFSFPKIPSLSSKKKYDVAISLGGDGTVLSAARAVAQLNVPVFPVNLGTFGFIAGVQPLEWQTVFKNWLSGKTSLSKRIMFDVSVKREKLELFRECCLNDVIISSSAVSKLISLFVSYGSNGKKTPLALGSYRSDGLIVSTPTGSTAYSAAAGGPIVDPELEAIIMSPICPFTLTHRPMVLPVGENLTITVDEDQQNDVLITLDGQVTEKLKPGDKIIVKKAAYPCQLIASGRNGFYQALRTKLSFAGEREQQEANVPGKSNKGTL